MQKWLRRFRSMIFVVIVISGSSTSFHTQASKQAATKQDQRSAAQLSTGQVQFRQEKFRKVGKAISNQYIVVLNSKIIGPRVEAIAAEMARAHNGVIKHVYKLALRGFSARMTETEALALSQNPSVEYVEEEGNVHATDSQTAPPWGLDRIDQRNLPRNNIYNYESTGQGVHVYVLDSGIRDTHIEFEGRATRDVDFIGDGQNGNDCRGHGTHVAGTIGGRFAGVAKKVRIHAVRVLGCDGNGPTSGVIAGVEWVMANRVNPAVANMSLGGDAYDALDAAVRNAINSGVTVVVAAGNDNVDASTQSPARVVEAITVGATNQNDSRASFSNIGPDVDLFAPGASILSAGIASDSALVNSSGTSMAAPHVAGVVARYLQFHLGVSPTMIQDAIKAAATTGVVTDPGLGSPNRLLYSTLEASVVYLDHANSSGIEDGSSQFPFRTLGASVNAVISGGTIVIRPGTYSGIGLYSKAMNWTAPSGNVFLN